MTAGLAEVVQLHPTTGRHWPSIVVSAGPAGAYPLYVAVCRCGWTPPVAVADYDLAIDLYDAHAWPDDGFAAPAPEGAR